MTEIQESILPENREDQRQFSVALENNKDGKRYRNKSS